MNRSPTKRSDKVIIYFTAKEYNAIIKKLSPEASKSATLRKIVLNYYKIKGD